MPKRFRELPPPPPNKPHASDAYESTIFAAELGETTEIDLHGESVDVAKSMLDAFLNHEFVVGTEVIKIIHGRGTGMLRDAVHTLLRTQTALVAAFRDAQSPKEQGGVTYAVLHRRSSFQ